MIVVSTSPFNISMLRRFNVWYSVKDGDWGDPSVWMGNGKKSSSIPLSGDDVYINPNHTISITGALSNYVTVNNLFIYGTYVNTTAYSLYVNGNLIVAEQGRVSINNSELKLSGYYNSVPYASFTTGGNGTVTYGANLNQDVLNLPYANLAITSRLGSGISKYLTSNLTISGSVNVSQVTLDLLNYNFTANGTGNVVNSGSRLIRSGTGLTATLTLNTTSVLENDSMIDVGATDIYFTGDLGYVYNSTITARNVYFTKNNVTIGTAHSATRWIVNANFIIPSGNTANNYQQIYLNNGSTIEGADSTAVFNHRQNYIYYMYAYAAMSVSGGTFNIISAVASIGYSFTGNYTIPYTVMYNLDISGSGIKSLSGNTTCSGTFYTGSGGCIFDPVSYNLTAAFGQFSSGSKVSRTGNIGKITVGPIGNFDFITMELNGTDIEFQGDIAYTYNVIIFAGNIIFSKTSSVQILGTTPSNAPYFYTQASNVLIKSGVTVRIMTYCQLIAGSGIVNGEDSISKLDVRSGFTYANVQAPMQTGILDCNQALNTMTYNLAGNQDITPGTYRNLILAGSGAKKLIGNVSVVNTYTLTAPATLDSNGFVLTNP